MSSDQSGRELFDEVAKIEDHHKSQEQQDDPFEDIPQQSQTEHKLKRIKKHKKDKKKKNKKKRHLEFEQDELSQKGGYDSMFENQADEDDEDEENISDAELDGEEERKKYEQLYQNHRRPTDAYFEKLVGKDDQQINKFYNQKAMVSRQTEQMLPTQNDHKMYIVQVKQGKQQQMVLCILNKASYSNRLKNKKIKMTITSALALKKKYPGKIFVQASNPTNIRQSLEGFIDVNLSKITPLDHQAYSTIFLDHEQHVNQYKDGDYIRIKKGLYENDLGKIHRVKKSSVDVLLVPRINMQTIAIKAKEQTAKLTDQTQIRLKKQQILKKYTNHSIYYPSNMRPPKKLLNLENFKQFGDVPGCQKIKLAGNGLIILLFRYTDIMRLQGPCLPIQLQPFSRDGKIMEEYEQEKKHLVSTVSFQKGDEAQIVTGELNGFFGVIVEIRDGTATIKCTTKVMEGNLLKEPIEHLSKRFKEGQRVRVVSGSDKGKTGLILKLQGRNAKIWTDNQNQIIINKNNLQLSTGEVICEENIHQLKKNDLIKTTHNVIGIVIATSKDNIKILDMNNTIQMISNLDFDSKIMTSNVTKNRSGEVIKKETIVRILQGFNEGKRCTVKHVYKEYVFVFNSNFEKTGGISVEKAENCAVIAKVADNYRPHFATHKQNNIDTNQINIEGFQQQLKIGKQIVLSYGPLKGYQGIIKSINKDRIEVRIPQKGCTEWIQKDKITAKEDSIEIGKTPHRGISMTNMYAQSPYL